MKSRRLLLSVVALLALALGVSVYAQVSRPYRNGSVWSIAFVRVKPGMNEAYMSYLAGQWKALQEAQKSAGLILSYKVIETEAHGTNDWNMMLMTEYKDMASMEANEDKAEALSQKVVGDDQKMMQGYRDRSEIRELMGERLARELVLEPRQ